MLSQKQTLEEYAKRNGLPNPTHFTDDGVALTLIADMLKAVADYFKNDRAEFIKTVQASQQATDITKKKRRLAAEQEVG